MGGLRFPAAVSPLDSAVARLTSRLRELEGQVRAGAPADDAVWLAYASTISALAAALREALPPGVTRLMTSEEMAARLGIAPKTLLAKLRRGEIESPAVQQGKLLRWSGREKLARNARDVANRRQATGRSWDGDRRVEHAIGSRERVWRAASEGSLSRRDP